MISKIISVVTLASLCCFSTAKADKGTFSYSYVEAGIADFVDDADGVTFLVGGSYNFAKNFNFLADFSTTNIDGFDVNGFDIGTDSNSLSIGLGFHIPINQRADFTASLKYLRLSTALSTGFGFVSQELDDANGYEAEVGVRFKATDKLELNAGLEYFDVEDESDTFVNLGVRFYFNDRFSAAVSYRSGDDNTDGVAGTVRYEF